MSDIASRSHSAARQFAIEIVARLRDAGYEALWAGGCVRDHLMGRAPKDYDVATSARPEEVQQVFGRRKTLAVGAAFGVIIVRGPRDAGQIEVATFRSDATYSDGRHPDSVRFTTAEEDSRRRDFTINGLFYDPIGEQVIDYVDGQTDLKQKLIRAIGDPEARIAEDKLRMLRAVRFAAIFDFALDADTADAIRRHAGEVTIVSAERIAGELRRMLTHANRGQAVELLAETELLQVILPEASVLIGDDASGGAWETTMSVLRCLGKARFETALAALIRLAIDRDRQGEVASSICRRWKLSNDESELLTWLLRHETKLWQAKELPWPAVQRMLIDPHINELVHLASAVVEAGGQDGDGLVFCQERLAWPPEKLNPPPLVDGNDLIAAGLKPGKEFATILHQVRDEQLEGRLATRQEALDLARRLAGQQ